MGSDAPWPTLAGFTDDFYPRSPRGERPAMRDTSFRRLKYFYPRSPRGERPAVIMCSASGQLNFYPRSPRGERHGSCVLLFALVQFLSTLPAWGATLSRTPTFPGFTDFYPRSPRGERHSKRKPRARRFCAISIHAPRVGSDLFNYRFTDSSRQFLSTLPAWGATRRQ